MVNPAGQLGSSVNALTDEYYAVAHNLANINTAGYKRRVSSFSRELMEQMSGDSSMSVPQGEISVTNVIDFSQGSLLKTERSLDVAISGKGFFIIETPNGPLYTRNGAFDTNPQGQLVDLEGRIVAGANGPIVIPAGVSVQQVAISDDGGVRAGNAALGRLKVVDFEEDEDKLVAVGKNCFAAPEDVTPAAAQKTLMKQGYQENSNVQRMEELVNLVTVSRLYETNMRLLQRRQENAKVILGVANS